MYKDIKLLNKESILSLKSILLRKSTFNSEYFLEQLSDYTVFVETWSRDTGHQWFDIAFKETLEYGDYGDLERSIPKKIGELNLQELLMLIWKIESPI